MNLTISNPPLVIHGSAVFEDSKWLRNRLTFKSPFEEDPIKLYKLLPDGMLGVPRGVVKWHPDDSVLDKRKVGYKVNFDVNWTPRNTNQVKFVTKSVQLLKEGENFIAQAYTGFGKTVCGSVILGDIGRKTLIVVTKEDIRDQWIKGLKMVLGLTDDEIGIIQGKKREVEDKKVVIAMIQTLYKAESKADFESFGLILWDEVHRLGADLFQETAWLFPAKLRLGLSATPRRRDGKDVIFLAHIGPVRVKFEGSLYKPRVFKIGTGWSVPHYMKNGVHIPMRHEPGKIMHVLKKMSFDADRNHRIVKLLKRAYDAGRIIILFSELKAHLQTLMGYASLEGIPDDDMALYVGGLSATQRMEAQRKQVLFATYAYTSEGSDIPWLDCLFMATPRSNIEQIVGRILREYPDKKRPLIFDFVDFGSLVLKNYSISRDRFYKKIDSDIEEF